MNEHVICERYDAEADTMILALKEVEKVIERIPKDPNAPVGPMHQEFNDAIENLHWVSKTIDSRRRR